MQLVLWPNICPCTFELAPESVVRAAENSAQQQRTKVNRQSGAVLAPAFGVAALRRHPGVRESPELEPAIGFAAFLNLLVSNQMSSKFGRFP